MDEKAIKILEEIRDQLKHNSQIAEKAYQQSLEMKGKTKKFLRIMMIVLVVFLALSFFVNMR